MTVERQYRRKDDSVIQVTRDAERLVSGGGHTLCGAVRDVTEHRQTEKALRARKSSCGRRTRWKPSASSPAASRTTSTTC